MSTSPPTGTSRPVPDHLSAAAAEWWRSTVESFELDDHHLKLLQAACEAWDRCQEAREELARSGAFYRDRFGAPKAHPAVGVERDARVSFARLVRELDLDGEPAPDPRMPRRPR